MRHEKSNRVAISKKWVVLIAGLWLGLASSARAQEAILLDVDGDGSVGALTDGLLIVRHLFGLSGSTLTSGALGPGATRDAAQISEYINQLLSAPPPPPPP